MKEAIESLMKFRDKIEIMYASEQVNNKRLRLVVTSRGSFIVYYDNEVQVETMQPFTAIEKYNSISLDPLL